MRACVCAAYSKDDSWMAGSGWPTVKANGDIFNICTKYSTSKMMPWYPRALQPDTVQRLHGKHYIKRTLVVTVYSIFFPMTERADSQTCRCFDYVPSSSYCGICLTLRVQGNCLLACLPPLDSVCHPKIACFASTLTLACAPPFKMTCHVTQFPRHLYVTMKYRESAAFNANMTWCRHLAGWNLDYCFKKKKKCPFATLLLITHGESVHISSYLFFFSQKKEQGLKNSSRNKEYFLGMSALLMWDLISVSRRFIWQLLTISAEWVICCRGWDLLWP